MLDPPKQDPEIMQNNLKELRLEEDLTQEKLADQIGVTRATILAIEKHGQEARLELAFKLARRFGCEIE